MPISLEKGQRISLDKEAGKSLSNICMGLGWDAVQKSGFFAKLSGSSQSIDLDASCLLFDENKNLVDAVWFRQLSSRDGSVQHTGDNRTGAGEGDDEKILVSLLEVPSSVHYLVFTVNSFTGQTFDSVANAYCRVVNTDDQKEIARYSLSGGGSHTAQIMAKLYRHNGEWKMHALGESATGRTFQDLLPKVVGML